MKVHLLLAVAVAAVVAPACTAPGGRSSTESAGGSGPFSASNLFGGGQAAGGGHEAPLYSRDGGVVAGRPPGTVVEGGPPEHPMEPTGEGRMYIVELYQQAIDERDALQIEVETLLATLEHVQARTDQVEGDLSRSRAEVDRLEGEKRALIDENIDLAGRLTTAQIRRLEAEELLLEAKLLWLRADEGGGATAMVDSDGSGASGRGPDGIGSSNWDRLIEEQP